MLKNLMKFQWCYTGVPNSGGISKICDFWPISCDISETVQDKDIVTRTTEG